MVLWSRVSVLSGFSLCPVVLLTLLGGFPCSAVAPSFHASPPDLYFSAVVGGTSPAPQVMVINNAVAGTTLKWSATVAGSGAAYCAVQPSEGSLVGQSGALLTVSVGVPAKGGSYQCTVNLSDNGSSPPASNSASVNVSYGVYAKGTTLPPPNTTAPNVPQYLSVVATGLGTVGFNWYSSGDASGYIAGYAVYRDGVQIGVTGLTSYQDSGLSAEFNEALTGNIGVLAATALLGAATLLIGDRPRCKRRMGRPWATRRACR
jgi:hypothetical protein